MLVEFFCAGPRWRVASAWVGLLVFVGHAVFNAWLKWALNEWYADFYDALQDAATNATVAGEPAHLAAKRREVAHLLVVFLELVAPAVVVHPLAKWIGSMWRFHWRMALVRAYLAHYDVAQPPVEGAAQRIHEDTSRFESGVYACFATVLDSVLTLVVFIPVLLRVGAQAHPPDVHFAAWLVCVAVGAAVGGLGISMAVGRRLVQLEVHNQRVEAALRTKLVLLEQSPATIVGTDTHEADDDAVDPDEFTDVSRMPPRPRRVAPAPFFHAVQQELWVNYRRLFANFAAFNTWISLYDQAMVVLPYQLAAPLMFAAAPSDRITLGTLMQVTNAFDKVFGAMAVVTENWTVVNDFRSTVVRLREFERNTYARKPYNHRLLSDAPADEPTARAVADRELATATMIVNGQCELTESGKMDDELCD